MRPRTTALICLVLWLPAASSPAAGEDAALENLYLHGLLAWAQRSPGALSDFSDLQQRLVDREAGFEVTLGGLGRYYGSKWYRLILSSGRSWTLGRRLPKSRCLGRLEHTVHSGLAELEPETLLPLAYVHHLLHALELGDPYRPWLAELDRKRSLWLAEHYLAQAGPVAVSGTVLLLNAVADVLASAGTQEHEQQARRVFYRVLELDPENPAALYWSAYLAERAGDYSLAVEHLRDLLEVYAADPEASLRLGINLARTGREAEADAELERLARGDGPGWLRILAYQELVRLRAEKGDEAAVSLLREAVAAFPESARLALQLSYHLRAEWSASSALARSVEERGDGDAGVTPRVYYGWPRRDEIDDDAARLLIEMERRTPALEAALFELLDRRPRFSSCRGAER